MSDDRLYDLVIEWDRRRQLGKDVLPETLCADRPELLPELRERIESVKATDWLFADADDTDDSFLTLPDFAALEVNGQEPVLPASDVSIDEFAEALSGSGLLTAEEITACQELSTADDAPALARDLIQRRKLTQYQASVLLGRKSDPLVLDRYVILDRIDAGGMGQVFKALHRSMKRVVALKILPPGAVDSPGKVQRFQREVEAAAQLSHPNVVTAHDAHEAGGVYFLVMEYVDGRNLRNLVREDGWLPVRRAVDTILQTARGLAYAHARGVIHRDIKPSNLMIEGVKGQEPRDKGQETDATSPLTLDPQPLTKVKILDMGLARFDVAAEEDDQTVSNELTQSGAVMGTPAYMAPEQSLDTHAADARSDVYSLGCTLYYLLQSSAPYSEDTGVKTIIAHREQPIPQLDEGRDDVPAELCGIYQRMMAKQPEERLQSMDGVITALEAIDLPEEPSETVVLSPAESNSDLPGGTPRSETDGRGDEANHAPVVRNPVSQRNRVSARRALGISGLFAAVLLAGIIIQVKTRDGVLQIEVPLEVAEDVTVEVDGERVEITNRDGEFITVEVAPGRHDMLAVTVGDIRLLTDADEGFEIDAGGEMPITARFVPEEPRPPGSGLATDSANFALSFDGQDDYVHIPSLELPTEEPFTVELFARLADANTGALISQGSAIRLSASASRLEITAQNDDGDRFEIHPFFNPFPDLLHAAVVFDGSSIRLFVNGVAVTETISLSNFHAIPDNAASRGILLGGLLAPFRHEPNSQHFFAGIIDEIRISSVARYTEDFTPDERFEPDEDTLALYHFDDFDKPNVLTDSSANGHHGEIHGATWVRTDAPLESQPPRTPLSDGPPGVVATLEGHTEYITGVATSPDGRTAISASEDGTVRVWDLETQQELRQLAHSQQPIDCVAISPDGRYALGGGRSHALYFWEVDTGRLVRALNGHDKNLSSVAFSSDGSRAISCDQYGTVCTWDLEQLEEVDRYEHGAEPIPWLKGVALSPDGRHALYGGVAGLFLWDLTTSVASYPMVSTVSRGTDDVEFLSDGRRAVSSSMTGIVLWDVAGGREIRRGTGHTLRAESIAVSQDERFVISAGADATLRMWDLETCAEIHRFDAETHSTMNVDVTPDGRFAVSGGGGWYEKVDGQQDLQTDGDYALRIWRLPRLDVPPRSLMSDEPITLVRTFDEGHTGAIGAVAYSPNGNLVASSSWDVEQQDRTIRLWDPETGEEVGQLGQRSGLVQTLDFSPDGQLLVEGDSNGDLRVWNVETGELAHGFGRNVYITSARFSADGGYVVAANHGSEDTEPGVRLWNLETGEELLFVGHTDGVLSVAVSSDARRLFSAGKDSSVRVWDVKTQAQTGFIDTESPVRCMDLSPDDRWIVTGHFQGRLKLWDAETRQFVREFSGHTGEVRSVAFSSDGGLLLSGSFDRTLRLWDVETGRQLREIRAERHFTNHVANSPDDQFAVTGGGAFKEDGPQSDGDYVLRLWRLPIQPVTESSQDRAVAEWVQSIGGSGQVNMDGRVFGFTADERAHDALCAAARTW